MVEYNTELISVNGHEVTLRLDAELDVAEMQRLSFHQEPSLTLEVHDKRAITSDQLGMIYGLFRDFAEYTGYPPEYSKQLMKQMFCEYIGIESFSLARNKMMQVQAGEFIEFILAFFLENGIPFKYQEFHLGSDITRVLFLYLKHRNCFVCGKPNSDLDHAESVGMGRDRRTIDHSKHRFMALCREHHTERHKIGLETFMDKYHVIPIKVTSEQIKEFKI